MCTEHYVKMMILLIVELCLAVVVSLRIIFSFIIRTKEDTLGHV